MKRFKTAALLLTFPTLAVIAYAAYLVAGGWLGRERIKTWIYLSSLETTYVITDDANGGDCAEVGSWDPESRTCTMTRDLMNAETIRIDAHNVTLDGANHHMRGGGSTAAAVVVANQNEVDVRNLEISGFENGIRLQHSSRCRLSDLRIYATSSHAIHVEGKSNFNAIVDNVLGPTDNWHGISVYWSDGNFIAGNEITGTDDAIRLQSSVGNVVTMNYVTESLIEGIDVHVASRNNIVMNDIFEDVAAPILDDTENPGANLFAIRYGGNFVTQFDTPDEGCVDEDGDGQCDAPFRFFRDVDPRPLVAPVTPKGREVMSETPDLGGVSN